MPTDTDDTLATHGQIFVTATAAAVYAEAQGLRHEEARRELTELLLEARCVEPRTDGPSRWRYRSRKTGLDITARVVAEGRLCMVVAITVRGRGDRDAERDRAHERAVMGPRRPIR